MSCQGGGGGRCCRRGLPQERDGPLREKKKGFRGLPKVGARRRARLGKDQSLLSAGVPRSYETASSVLSETASLVLSCASAQKDHSLLSIYINCIHTCMQSNVSGGPEKTSFLSIYITGVPRSQETGPPGNPTVGQGLGPCSGPGGEALSYERGTPVNVVCSVKQLCSCSLSTNCHAPRYRGTSLIRKSAPSDPTVGL